MIKSNLIIYTFIHREIGHQDKNHFGIYNKKTQVDLSLMKDGQGLEMCLSLNEIKNFKEIKLLKVIFEE